MMRVRREAAATPASEVLAGYLIRGFFDQATIYLEAEPPAFGEAATMIEAFRAVVEGVGDRLGEHQPMLTEALGQLQMIFVQVGGTDRARRPRLLNCLGFAAMGPGVRRPRRAGSVEPDDRGGLVAAVRSGDHVEHHLGADLDLAGPIRDGRQWKWYSGPSPLATITPRPTSGSNSVTVPRPVTWSPCGS